MHSKFPLLPFPLSSSLHLPVHPDAVFTTGVQLVRQLFEPSHPKYTSLFRLIGPKVGSKKNFHYILPDSKIQSPKFLHSWFSEAALNWKSPVMTLYRRRLTGWQHQGYDGWPLAQLVWKTQGGDTNDQLSLCLAQQMWCGYDESRPW